ncbi:LysR family transcriptional regulator [Luteitalea sp. TBR-22]|uniref:LysR family transcriptional regulator n=1 Tax=Luteitalea sp. TBR-22 TaxID=2802971 RepID=UPI001AF7B8C7|nr:LysR family transcriptional regulator [Luteitalea sp. TBR-22]BCS32353.1 LysR family transcriptional regulator [Luteitalea sp. TBR-22]
MRAELGALAAFVAVAEERSFTRAAKRLGVSASALSHAMRALEERLGVRLLSRTTRSVSPTEAGSQLLERLAPALGDIDRVLEDVSQLRDRPAGRVRLLIPRLAARMVLAPRLAAFNAAYPDVVLDVTTDDSRLDIVAGRFDAGVHLGEFIERDMIAVRVSPDQRAAIVASPRYLAAHPAPLSPRDLTRHQCINIRMGLEGIYRWEFERGDESITVGVSGPLDTDDIGLTILAALDGLGLAFALEQDVRPHLESGALVRVLEDWCPPFPGFYLYYPSRRQQPPALAALIDTLRLS